MPYEFEKLPLLAEPLTATDFLVHAIVEQEYGTTERTNWDAQKREFVKTGMVLSVPLPAPYGWLPQTLCAGDGDALDVLILTNKHLPQGSWLVVRPIGVLLRADRDDKILAVDITDPTYQRYVEASELDVEKLNFIADWFRPYFALEGWGDAAAARSLILASQKRS
jgi:inorganic pyrophosphatase